MKLPIVMILLALKILAQGQTPTSTPTNQPSPCLAYGNFPTSFQGQKCWLSYALKDSIFVYGDKLNSDGVLYRPIKISLADIDSFFVVNKGENNSYLPENYTAWGGNWYACAEGGIARRFHASPQSFPSSNDLNWARLKKMSPEEIFKLSPAEKFDLYMNDSLFKVTRFELQHRGPERPDHSDDGFCGFCNGARIAGAILPEPRHEVTLWSNGVNTQPVKFSVADIKALMSAAYMHPAFTFSFGKSDEPNGDNNPNPGIFDVFLRLYLGKNKLPFVVDDAFGPALFNETVLGYNRIVKQPRNLTLSERTAFPSARRAVEVNVTLYLQDELSFSTSENKTVSIMADSVRALSKLDHAAVHGKWVHKNNYNYFLFVDENNTIIDGKWLGEPIDFFWAAHGNPNEDDNVVRNETPGIPTTDRNKNLIWPQQLSFLLRKSLE